MALTRDYFLRFSSLTADDLSLTHRDDDNEACAALARGDSVLSGAVCAVPWRGEGEITSRCRPSGHGGTVHSAAPPDALACNKLQLRRSYCTVPARRSLCRLRTPAIRLSRHLGSLPCRNNLYPLFPRSLYRFAVRHVDLLSSGRHIGVAGSNLQSRSDQFSLD